MICTFFGITELYDKDFPNTVRGKLRTFIENNDNIEFWFHTPGRPCYEFLFAVMEEKAARPDKHMEIVCVADFHKRPTEEQLNARDMFLPACLADRILYPPISAERSWERNRQIDRWIAEQCNTIFLYYYPELAYDEYTFIEKLKNNPAKSVIPLASAETVDFIDMAQPVITEKEACVMREIRKGSPISQIARQTGCTASAVQKKRNNASRKIRSYLRPLRVKYQSDQNGICGICALGNVEDYDLHTITGLFLFLILQCDVTEFWVEEAECSSKMALVLMKCASRFYNINDVKVKLVAHKEVALWQRYVPPYDAVAVSANLLETDVYWNSCKYIADHAQFCITNLSGDGPFAEKLRAHFANKPTPSRIIDIGKLKYPFGE